MTIRGRAVPGRLSGGNQKGGGCTSCGSGWIAVAVRVARRAARRSRWAFSRPSRRAVGHGADGRQVHHLNDRRTPIMPPIREGSRRCARPAQRGRDPSQVAGAAAACRTCEEFRDDIGLTEPLWTGSTCRVLPLTAAVHHCHWKCIVYHRDVRVRRRFRIAAASRPSRPCTSTRTTCICA
jgi:hypothetical protein